MLSRRLLLTLLAGGSAAGCARSEPVAGGPDPVGGSDATLVVVFQRFAADWINMLVPAGDSAYAALRPTLRVERPLPLDGYYGLHPALSPLLPLYESGELAFVTATGWRPTDSRSRSHFYAQSLAEAGARRGIVDGWLGRSMKHEARRGDLGLWAALAAEAAVPQSLQGYADAIAIRDFSAFTHGSSMGDAATNLIDALATEAGDPGRPIRRLATGMREIAASPPPQSTAPYPDSVLGNGLRVAAQAIRGGLTPRIVTVTSDDDWDTHVAQASRHAQHLPRFAQALSAFREDVGPLMDRVVLVTMTEFGRKARENLGGTDHGTASSMLVMGGGVNGGRVHGDWPGLHASALYEGEDLEPTTDFRAVLGELLVRHLGFGGDALDGIFPGGYAAASGWRGLLA